MKHQTRLNRLYSGFLALATLAGVSLGTANLYGQSATATVLGVVTDGAGAVVPEAAIQVRNLGTGYVQNSTSDNQGRYTAANLGIGDYEIQASKTGFSTALRRGVTLTVGSQNVVDFSLKFPVAGRFSGRFDAKNLLDAQYRIKQGSVTRETYFSGRAFSMGFTYQP